MHLKPNLLFEQYGGCIALFYSLVFDIFGTRNYRTAFCVSFKGFALSIIIGGLSSAYSFSSFNGQTSSVVNEVTQRSNQWFYSMAGLLFASILVLHSMMPVKYDDILLRRIKSISSN